MDIDRWLRKRQMAGSTAHLAKRMAESQQHYDHIENTLRQMYVLEIVIQNGGDQKKAAAALGVTRHTVQRIMREAGMRCADIREAVRALKEAE